MKTNHTELERLLHEWRVTSPLPPRFNEQVWKRIERAEVSKLSALEAMRAWFGMTFARPAFAVAYVSVLLVMGTILGFAQASHKAAQWDRDLEARYVQLIDPYQRSQ